MWQSVVSDIRIQIIALFLFLSQQEPKSIEIGSSFGAKGYTQSETDFHLLFRTNQIHNYSGRGVNNDLVFIFFGHCIVWFPLWYLQICLRKSENAVNYMYVQLVGICPLFCTILIIYYNMEVFAFGILFSFVGVDRKSNKHIFRLNSQGLESIGNVIHKTYLVGWNQTDTPNIFLPVNLK